MRIAGDFIDMINRPERNPAAERILQLLLGMAADKGADCVYTTSSGWSTRDCRVAMRGSSIRSLRPIKLQRFSRTRRCGRRW